MIVPFNIVYALSALAFQVDALSRKIFRYLATFNLIIIQGVKIENGVSLKRLFWR